MSKTIDERVVEMRFDNKQFETNAETSISTLGRLKKALKLDDAAKGLDGLGNASKKCDMSLLGRSAESVSKKFTALETVAVGALLRIGSKAVDTGEQLLKSLTVDNIAAGWKKYGEKTASVQTIMNATGKTIEEVNGYLNKLMWYSDETSYSFTDMTSALATMVSSGGNIDNIIPMIMGVANATAYAGKSTTEFSASMRQLVQSYSTGSLKAQDWRVMEQWGATSSKLKEVIIQTGEYFGTIKKGKVTVENFTESLSKGWATTEVLEKAYSSYASMMEEAYELVNSGQYNTAAEALESLTDKYEDYVVAATQSAQSAKSFNEAIDATVDAVSSGWMKTFEIIFGNYQEAKVLWSDLAEVLWTTFAAGGERRNELLQEALSTSGFDAFKQGLTTLGVDLEAFQTQLKATAEESGISFDEIVADAGSLEAAFQNGSLSGMLLLKAFRELNPSMDQFDKVTRESGISLWNLAMNVDQLDGRQHLIQAFWNTWESGSTLIGTLKDAFGEIFPETTAEQIYNLAKGLDELTGRFKSFLTETEEGEKVLGNLKSTFKGLFAVVDLISSVIGGAFKAGFKLLGPLFGSTGSDILEMTGNLGEALVTFRDWVKENDYITKSFDKITNIISAVIQKIKTWSGDIRGFIQAFLELPIVSKTLAAFREAFRSALTNFPEFLEGAIQVITDFIRRVREMDSLSLDNIRKIFNDFVENVLGYFSNFGKIFGKFGESIEGFKDEWDKFFASFTQGFETAQGKAGSIVEKIIGFFVKMKNKLFETATSIREKLADKIGFSEIFGLGLGAVLVSNVKKIAKALEFLAHPIENIASSLSFIFKMKGIEVQSEALYKFAEAILMLVGALAILTLIDKEKIWDAMAVLGVLTAGLLAVNFLMILMGKLGKPAEMGKIAAPVIALGISLLLIAKALETIAELKLTFTEALGALAILGVLIIALVAASNMLGTVGKDKKSKTGALTMVAFALAIKILVGVLKSISEMGIYKIGESLAILTVLILELSLFMSSAKNVSMGGAATILAAAFALKMIIAVFKQIDDMHPEAIAKGLMVLIPIFGMFALLELSSRLAGENAAKAGAMVLEMSVALLIIVGVIKMIAGIPDADLKRASETIVQMFGIFALVTMASKLAGENAAKAGAMILMMSGAMLLLSLAMIALAHMDPEGLERAKKTIEELLVIFGALIGVTKLAQDVKGTIIALIVAAAVLAAAVAALSLMDPERLQNATLCLGALIGMFALLVAATGKAQKATGTILLMVGVVAALAVILGVLAKLDAEASLVTATAISELLLALSLAFVILGKAGTLAEGASKQVYAIAGVVAILAGILGVMAYLNVEASLTTATALSELLLALSGAFWILGNAKSINWSTIGQVAVLAVLTGVLAKVLADLAKLEVQPSIETATALSILLLALSGACVILSYGGKAGWQAALTGVGTLVALIGAIGGIMAAICALTQDYDIDALEASLDKAIMVLEKIGTGLGAAIGGVTGGLLEGATSTLPKVGQNIADFVTTISPAIDAVNSIKPGSVEQLKTLMDTLVELNMNDVLTSIKGNVDMENFGNQLSEFADAVKNYADKAAELTEDDLSAIQRSTEASNLLVQLANTIPKSGGIWQDIFGETDMAAFGKSIVSFMESLNAYATYALGFSETHLAAVDRSVQGASKLTELAGTIPKSGGIWQQIFGEQDMASFGKSLVAFMQSLNGYATYALGFSETHLAAVERTAKAAAKLTELSKGVPKSGGAWQQIFGEQDMAAFGKSLVAFMQGLNGYATYALGFSETHLSAVERSVQGATKLTELANQLPKSGGIWQDVFGEQDMSKFGKSLTTFGQALSDYSASVQNVNIPDLTSVISQMFRLIDLLKAAKDIGTGSVNFQAELKNLGTTGVQAFIDAWWEADTDVTNAVQHVLEVASSSAGNWDTTIFNTAGVNAIKAITAGISDNLPLIQRAGESIGTTLIKGMASKTAAVKSAAVALMNTAASGARSQVSGFYSVGQNIGDGLVRGIRSKISAAAAAGRELGLAALQASQRAVDSHSPSKEYIHLGEYMGDGLVIGINNRFIPVANASRELGEEAVAATKSGLESFEKWLDDKKYYGETSLAAELEGWTELQKQYKEGTEEWLKIEREKFRVQNELVAATYQSSLDWIEQEKFYDRLSKKEELEAYERMLERYREGSKERIALEKNIYQTKKELMDADYEHSMDWIEQEKNYGRMSLADELAAHTRVLNRQKWGTDKWKKESLEVYRLTKEIYEAQEQYISDIQELQASAAEKRLSLEQEYEAKVKEINDRLERDIQSLNDQYESALNSRTDSLYKSYGLFDEVAKRETVSSDTLMVNLENQVKEFGEWQDILNSLSARGVSKEFIKELQEMGPSAIGKLEALNSMTDAELEKYTALWADKHSMARQQAVEELVELRIETNQNIVRLREEAEVELEEYRVTWQEQMDELERETQEKMEKLRKEFAEKVGLIKKDTEKEFQEMVKVVREILANAGWDEMGQQIPAGLAEGIREGSTAFLDALEEMAMAGNEAFAEVEDIQSPSRVYRQFGRFIDEGLVLGINDYKDKVSSSAETLGDTATEGFTSALQIVDELLNSDVDMQPTIRPVLDLSDIQQGAEELNGYFCSGRTLGLAGQISRSTESASEIRKTLTVDNSGIIQELRALRGDVDSLSASVRKLRVVLDTGTLVGEIAEPMDNALGKRAVLKGRRV